MFINSQTRQLDANKGNQTTRRGGGYFRFFRFFEPHTLADTGNGAVKRPYFLSDHIRPSCTEYRGNRLRGILFRS